MRNFITAIKFTAAHLDISLIMDQQKLKRLLIGEFSLKRLVRSVIFIYVCLCLWAYFFSDMLIFQPQPSSYQDSNEILKLMTADGVQISAAYLPNKSAAYTLLYSHGNAEDLIDVLPVRKELRDSGFAVLAYDYRGYGTSQGKPSESNAYLDIDAAYNYLTQKLRVPPQQIIVYGRSVGGGPSVDLASRKPVAGLILESAFTTAFRVRTFIPILPFDKFDNLDKMRNVHCPVLIIHGKADNIVPFSHGQQLFAAAHKPKRCLWVDGAGHDNVVDVAGELYFKTLREFIQIIPKLKR